MSVARPASITRFLSNLPSAFAATGLVLCLGSSLGAQDPASKPVVKEASHPPAQPASQPTEKAATEAPPPREMTPQERLASLRVTLDKVTAEKQRLANIENSGGLVPRLLEHLKRRNVRGDNVVALGPAMPKPKHARLLGDAEKAQLDEEVVFTVDSLPVTQKEFDSLYNYLRSYPRPQTAAAIKAETILTLVKAKAAEAAGKENVAKALEATKKIRSQLEAGTSFDALAKEHSQDEATAAKGGDLGYVTRQYPDKLCAQVLFTMKLGEVSGVVRGTQGFHILRVRGAKKGATADKDRIRASHILVPYTGDMASLKAVTERVANADVDLAFRDKELRKFAPEQFK